MKSGPFVVAVLVPVLFIVVTGLMEIFYFYFCSQERKRSDQLIKVDSLKISNHTLFVSLKSS